MWLLFLKNGPFPASFLYFRLFYKQLTVNKCSIKVADDWIRTWVLWYRKQPLCQLRHNHLPKCDFFYPNRLHYISCAIRKFVYDVSSQVILYFTIIVGKFVLCFKDRKRKKMRPRFARVKKVYIVDSTNKLPFILTSFCSPVKMVKRGIRWVEICRICQSLWLSLTRREQKGGLGHI